MRLVVEGVPTVFRTDPARLRQVLLILLDDALRHTPRGGQVRLRGDVRDEIVGLMGAPGNIADQAAAEALVDFAISTHGRLDVLVNNAGVMDYMQGVGALTDEVWRRVLGINLDGPMFTMRRAVPRMLQQGDGSIVNDASTAGIEGGAAG